MKKTTNNESCNKTAFLIKVKNSGVFIFKYLENFFIWNIAKIVNKVDYLWTDMLKQKFNNRTVIFFF